MKSLDEQMVFEFRVLLVVVTVCMVLFLLTFAFGCSHLSVADMRYIANEAKTIQDVHDRVGGPEETRFNGGYEEAWYIDKGRHFVNFASCIPVIGPGFLYFIFFPDFIFGNHYRGVVVVFDPGTGRIRSVRQLEPGDVKEVK